MRWSTFVVGNRRIHERLTEEMFATVGAKDVGKEGRVKQFDIG